MSQQKHQPPRNNVPPRTLVVIDGVDHVHRGHVSGRHDMTDAVTGLPFLMMGDDGATTLPDDAQFADLVEADRVRFRPATSGERVRLLDAVGRMTLQDALAIDEGAERRLAVCELLDSLGTRKGDKSIDIALRKHWSNDFVARFGDAPPVGTVRRWLTERGTAGRRHAREMVALTGRTRRRSDLPDVVQETLQKHALLKIADDSSPRGAYALFAAEIARINRGEGGHPAPVEPYGVPCKRTFRRRVNALEQSRTVAAGRGKLAVEQGWEGGGRSLVADHAMHRIIIDHTRVDVHVVSDDLAMVLGRPWLSIAIDVFTRAIVGWVLTFIDPSAWTVAELLRRVALPKRPPAAMLERYPVLRDVRGRPVEIVLDNAAEFTSHDFEAAVRATGMAVRWCPIKKPRYRAVGERAFETINDWLCSDLPGRVLPVEEAKLLGYDPEDKACVMMEELEAALNQVVAEYNTEPHGGLGGRQPALVFAQEARRRGIDVWLDFDSFRLDTLPVRDGVQLSPSGVRAFGLRFVGKREVVDLLDDLVPVEGRRQRRDQATATISFRYDPTDIGRIHVWNRVRREYVTLTCSDERYADGMPLSFHRELASDAKSQAAAFNTEAEREAFRATRIEAIRAISPTAGARARKAVADLLEVPRVRQIVGNVVMLRTEGPEPASIGVFISHERAAETAFDVEVRAPRSAVPPRRPSDLDRRRDARDAGRPEGAGEGARPKAAPARRRRGAGATS